MISAVRFWTHYWTNATVENSRDAVLAGDLPLALDHTAGNSFRVRGVLPGDVVYVVSYHGGSVRIIGRLIVARVVDQATAEGELSYQPWEAADHLLGDSDMTDHQFDVWLTAEQVRDLEFIGPRGKIAGAKFNPEGSPDQQTLRTVREITERSARLLDELLA